MHTISIYFLLPALSVVEGCDAIQSSALWIFGGMGGGVGRCAPGVGNRPRRPPRTSARSGYLPDPCTSTSPERLSRPPPGVLGFLQRPGFLSFDPVLGLVTAKRDILSCGNNPDCIRPNCITDTDSTNVISIQYNNVA
jgi:hypothetical protein